MKLYVDIGRAEFACIAALSVLLVGFVADLVGVEMRLALAGPAGVLCWFALQDVLRAIWRLWRFWRGRPKPSRG